MEEELDLRELVAILVKRWRLVAATTLVAALAALVVSVLLPPRYEATAGIAIVKYKPAVSFDSRFLTLSEEALAAGPGRQEIWDLEARRQAFAELVKSGAIAEQIIAELGGHLDKLEQQPPRLLEMVRGEVGKNTDLIRITVQANDPQKASAIANAWGRRYEQQVNSLYSGAAGSYPVVQSQEREAKAQYDTAQEALADFIAENRIDELSRLMSEKQSTIAVLQQAKQTAVNLALEKGYEAKRQLLTTYIAAEVSSRMAALDKDRQARSDIFSQFVDAEVRAKQAVFNEQVAERIGKLAERYATKAKLERLLDDAQSLRAQAASGGGSASNSLAILLLKAQAFASSVGLPGELQLQLQSLAALDTGSAAQAADLQALSQVLEQRIAGLDAEIEALSQELLGGMGYSFLEDVTASRLSLASAPTETSTPGDARADSLAEAIPQRYAELFQIGETAQGAQAIAAGTDLFADIRELYPQLFALDELSALAGLSTRPDSEEGNSTSAAQPLEQAIMQLQGEVRQLEAQLEQETARKRELQRARDLTWEAFSTLSSKKAEVGVEAAVTGSEVRFASPAVAPLEPVWPRKTLNVAVAGVIGVIIGSIGAFVTHNWGETQHISDGREQREEDSSTS